MFYVPGIPKASQLMSLSRSTSGSNPASSSSPVQAGVNMIAAATSSIALNAVTGTLSEHQSSEPSLIRPRCSSILHLFGPWLFEAAFIGSEFAKQFASKDLGAATPGARRPADLGLQQSMTPRPAGASGHRMDALDLPPSLTSDKFQTGRAEALGALCRIFCAKKTGEEIVPSYLARFYIAVQQGLKVGPDKVSCHASVEINDRDTLI